MLIGALYKHFKGGYYRVLGFATHTETGEELALYKNIKDSKVWARPFDMFTGKVEVDGVLVDRMRLVESYSEEISIMLKTKE